MMVGEESYIYPKCPKCGKEYECGHYSTSGIHTCDCGHYFGYTRKKIIIEWVTDK